MVAFENVEKSKTNPSLLEETECGSRLDIGWPAVRILGKEGLFSSLWPIFCFTLLDYLKVCNICLLGYVIQRVAVDLQYWSL